MSIEQRLEQIEKNQREILRLLGFSHVESFQVPRRDSLRRAEAFARKANRHQKS
ncbi:hypothetical protein [uncultured Desulfuromusa sp.]|uniref:hypothetical protein n=1 Tax=uncultured Desulfuromusa sp. TaxID=219183 RepID=UPI002AA703A1|nr:hypothetical protein [uncultured Desulfuromusa sp.]